MNLFIETLKPKLHSFKESLYLLAQNKLSLLAAIALVLIILVAAFSPYIVPYPQDISDEAHIAEKLLPPSGCAFHTAGPMQVKAAETIGSVMGKELGATLLFLCIFRSVWYTAAKKIHREGSAMRAEERRQAILNTLNSAGHPVSASALARQFSVSRQIVVGVVALLRASGANISATPRGYVVLRESGGLIRQVACQHDAAGMEAELNAMVDHGCTVLDVIVDHPIYGQLTGPLQLASRYDVSQFIARCARAEARPLSDLTGGIHLHTLSCPDEAAFQRVEDALRNMSVLLE